LHAIEGAANPTLIAYKAIDSLLALGMNAMQTMPYDQALALCEAWTRTFRACPFPFPVSPTRFQIIAAGSPGNSTWFSATTRLDWNERVQSMTSQEKSLRFCIRQSTSLTCENPRSR